MIPAEVQSGGDKALVAWMDANDEALSALVRQVEADYAAKNAAALLKVNEFFSMFLLLIGSSFIFAASADRATEKHFW